MTRSKFTFNAVPGFWIVFIITIVLFPLEFYILFWYLPHLEKGRNRIELAANSAIILATGTYFFFWLKVTASRIAIDSNQMTISFTNYFTSHISTYSFYDLDGYIETVYVNSKTGRRHKVLCLVKDKVIQRKISAVYYSNMEELEKSLKPLQFLGFKKFGIINQLKILFKQPVLE